jgi:Fur family transcriptional regulator, ferric uptake regulator
MERAKDVTANHSRLHVFALRFAVMAATGTHEHGAGWGEHARRELARTGHRAGGAREQVLALLERQHCCLSAQEIHDRLRETDGRTPGLASVYRALEVLTSLRLVHRLDVDGTACFEPADPSGDHHHHAICERCGKRDAFADPELERLIHGVGERLGYQIGGHDIVLHGRCPACL